MMSGIQIITLLECSESILITVSIESKNRIENSHVNKLAYSYLVLKQFVKLISKGFIFY